jgi:protein-disulfide isomerase/uncharacterized membrane protein
MGTVRAAGWLRVLVAFAVFGLAFSIASSVRFYQLDARVDGGSVCNLSSTVNCDQVINSAYGRLFGDLPTSSLPAGMLGGLLLLMGWASVSSRKETSRAALQVMLAVSILGAAASLVLLHVMLFTLRTICLYCLAIDASVLGILAVLWIYRREFLREGWARPVLLARTGLAFSLGFLMIAASTRLLEPASRMDERIDRLLEDLRAERGPAAIAQVDGYPRLGNPKAPIQIVEYVDFLCPDCRQSAEALDAVIRRFPSEVGITLKFFPLDQTCNGAAGRKGMGMRCMAAKSVLCAPPSGTAAVIHEVFSKQAALSEKELMLILKRAGLSGEQALHCIHSERTSALLLRSTQEAQALGVREVPAVFVNGIKLSSSLGAISWKRLIGRMLREEKR